MGRGPARGRAQGIYWGMRTTAPEVLELQVQAYRAMSAERKLALAAELRGLVWEMRLAALRTECPGAPEEELRARVRDEFVRHPG